jgi:simple sugar transport system ATP-binding protein
MTETATQTPRLVLKGMRKVYPSVIANDNVDLTVMPGEIHAVVGENGAGKSTLMKAIYGVIRPDAGEIIWEGQHVNITSPGHARELGIGMVFQHFSLFETLTVAQNVALALPGKFDLAGLSKRIIEVSERYGLPIDPRRLVYALSVGERQRVEIIRCLLQSPRLLILDEPTSVLTRRRCASCSRRCASWPLKASASSTSATSWTRSRSCATPPPSSGRARSPAPASPPRRRPRRSPG